MTHKEIEVALGVLVIAMFALLIEMASQSACLPARWEQSVIAGLFGLCIFGISVCLSKWR